MSSSTSSARWTRDGDEGAARPPSPAPAPAAPPGPGPASPRRARPESILAQDAPPPGLPVLQDVHPRRARFAAPSRRGAARAELPRRPAGPPRASDQRFEVYLLDEGRFPHHHPPRLPHPAPTSCPGHQRRRHRAAGRRAARSPCGKTRPARVARPKTDNVALGASQGSRGELGLGPRGRRRVADGGVSGLAISPPSGADAGRSIRSGRLLRDRRHGGLPTGSVPRHVILPRARRSTTGGPDDPPPPLRAPPSSSCPSRATTRRRDPILVAAPPPAVPPRALRGDLSAVRVGVRRTLGTWWTQEVERAVRHAIASLRGSRAAWWRSACPA